MHRPTASLADLQHAFSVRNRAAINAILRQWLDHAVDVGDRWAVFAETLAVHGEWTLAVRASERHLAAAPTDLRRRFAHAVMLARAGRHRAVRDQAEALVASGTGPGTDTVAFRHFAGALASGAGAFDDARHHFLAVIAARPASGQTWRELSAIHAFTRGDPLLDDLRRAVETVGQASARAPLLYALGKALNDIGECDDAFDAFAAGAAIVAVERAHDPARDRAQALAMLAEWDGVALPRFQPAPETEPETVPLFVTGLPRSGTTLVEQILASHPAIAGGGELNLLSILIREAGGTGPNALSIYAMGQGSQALASIYRHLCAERFGTGARVVDKSLDIGRMLGFVTAVLSSAPILWVRRRAIDTAWSCFRTYFARGVPWSWSLESIAAHVATEDAVFAFWKDRLGARLLVVDYEALVGDPEAIIPHVEAHAGLGHDPRTLTPHLTQRHVLTSSVAQVRRPIYRDAVGSAHAYRHRLTRFSELYDAGGGPTVSAPPSRATS